MVPYPLKVKGLEVNLVHMLKQFHTPRSLLLFCSTKPLWNLEISMNFSCGVRPKSHQHSITVRSFSTEIAEGSEKSLPWLEEDKVKQTKRPEKVVLNRSSWGESADKLFKGAEGSVEFKRYEDRRDNYKSTSNSGEEDDEGEMDDPRWDRIKSRFSRIKVRPRSDRPEVRRWNNQDSWGKKTWKEASESTLPRMIGEGVYGVGPVLAALSAGRREFYGLYIQEGLDLSGNNRKKKDKKGFERVLRTAEKVGLSIKEVSKHDLNMISDNRPHQGLVLDTSPLEMVGIKELEPVSIEEDTTPLWVALDEVTDPQNLGAIIRSAYFFGASGIVLCAKNSAPLSGVVSKASAGSLELMELRSCKNMMQFLTSSAENGWRVLGGSVSSRAVPLHKIVPGAPTILVLGSEGTGLRPLVERSCTELVGIPGNIPLDIIAAEDEDAESDNSILGQNFRSFMAVESLNVSVAAGIW
uniref:rRNA methyltransferase 1, mitochondrial n=1 Tax=Solanum lycopersicum TaxID=4081 RepID=A0A3Q7GJE3_SOLLC